MTINRRITSAGAVIMQYTGLSEVTGNEPPTYACVGTSDWIASFQTMEDRISWISKNGTDMQGHPAAFERMQMEKLESVAVWLKYKSKRIV